MINTDRWLTTHAAALGINPDHINPASVDLCLGGEILEVAELRTITHTLEPGETFSFFPGVLYLCHTAERTRIPDDCVASLYPKSSTSRKGLGMNIGLGDPGFDGQWTFGVTAAVSCEHVVGAPIVQLVFQQTTSVPARTYAETGRYQGSMGVTREAPAC